MKLRREYESDLRSNEHYLSNSEKKAWKNSGLYEIWTHDHCDTAVQIHDFHMFTTVYSPLHGFIWNQNSDQLPVGLLAQLVELCTGIAEVRGSNPVQAWIFSGLLFTIT